jgi:hypothetical protein
MFRKDGKLEIGVSSGRRTNTWQLEQLYVWEIDAIPVPHHPMPIGPISQYERDAERNCELESTIPQFQRSFFARRFADLIVFRAGGRFGNADIRC